MTPEHLCGALNGLRLVGERFECARGCPWFRCAECGGVLEGPELDAAHDSPDGDGEMVHERCCQGCP